MADPVIAQKSPCLVNLQPGTYWWCSCGRSATQPFCDGSHTGSEFSPRELVIEKPGPVMLCACKRSKTAPYCDGTHGTL